MDPIKFDPTSYRLNDEPFYLNSGEFHYFRVPKEDWRARMARFKAAGGNCLATYIPWLIHEPQEGRFVFGGEEKTGSRDLETFLETALDLGLYVIARPGPYQYSELIYGGLPAWLFERYPQIQARTLEGEPFGLPSASYVHPTFLEKTRAWLEAVCPILAGYTISQGGPIAFTQFDNELTGVHLWFGGMDYNRESMGLGVPNGRYPRFLADRYETITRLNHYYETAYTAFSDVRPLPGERADSLADIRRARDYFEFYLATVNEYAAWLCATMRDLGIDTPFIHNAANPEMNPYFREMTQALGDEFLLGSDHYYNLDQHWPQNNPTPQYARRVFISNQELERMGYPPTVLELPSGSASDWPPITATDAEACYMTNLAYGMKGHNYYVFTGGPNPPNAGETTDLYDYNAPIGAEGEVRPLYEVQKRVAAFIAGHPWLLRARPVHDCRFLLDLNDARAERYWCDLDEVAFTPADAWRFLETGLLTTAFCNAMSPIAVDAEAEAWADDTETPLLVASSARMARGVQMRLIRYLQNGGRLLIAPTLPTLDEHLERCTLLADFLGAEPMAPVAQTQPRVEIGEVANVLHTHLFAGPHPPARAAVLGRETKTRRAVAWALETPGGGRAVMLGMAWTHRKWEQAAVLDFAMDRLDFEPRLALDNPNVWATLRADGSRAMLFLLNLYSAPMETDVRYRPHPGGPFESLGRLSLNPMSVRTLEVEL